MPTVLHEVMTQAWSGPPPPLPQKWAEPDQLESYDTYCIFGGKLWFEVISSQVPLYFNALVWLTGKETLYASTYYLASYMKCLFYVEGDARERIITDTAYFLELIVAESSRFELSVERCRAVALFLEITRKDFEEWDEELIADQWNSLVAS